MSVRRGPVELGSTDAADQQAAIGRELLTTRLALGLSRRFVARRAGASPSRLARIETGAVRNPSILAICRVARVLGLSLSLRLFPAGSPARDAGQLALLRRVEPIPAPPLRLRREVVLPDASNRAWDMTIEGDDGRAFLDAEVRLGDIQALTRRLMLKLRDDPRGSILILLVARTRHNRDVLALHREALRELLPLDGAAILRALRAGRLPPASGLIVL